MRSTFSLRRQLARNANPNRKLTTALPRPSQISVPICRACSRNLESSNTHSRSQRRWQTTSTTSPQPHADDAIKSNPIPQTHYEFFPKTLPSGPPPNGPFHIDVRELRREFLQLQSIAHPDRHPQHLKTRAEATSARINEAYKTLQNPLLRAQYLLGLRGIDVAEDETAKVDDPELLMEVLDAREEIENAREEGELEEMRRVNEERIEESEGVLDRAFRADDLVGAKEEAVRLRYWVNIRESLDAWERGKPVVLVH
ncbi:putative chaperone [Cadophora sp. MPI-SDFR-AT-0126]|nr:putative chaperone [Leotiomycetes sp. MPI-SDFR-AT-0126]